MREPELTPEERRLSRFLRMAAVGFLGFAIFYVVIAITSEPPFPYVANSVAKDGLFAGLAAVAAADVRRHGWAVTVIVVGHVFLVAALVLSLVSDGSGTIGTTFPESATDPVGGASGVATVWLIAAPLFTVALIFMRARAIRSRLGLSYLSPVHYNTLKAMAEVMVGGPDAKLSPDQVAKGVDDYLASFSDPDKKDIKLALLAIAAYPLLRFKVPLSLMAPQDRKDFLEARFVSDIVERRLPGFLRGALQAAYTGAQQMVFIGYYADPATFDETGYVPFSSRPRAQPLLASFERSTEPLQVRDPSEIDTERMNADVVIIGSGAGGSIMAHRLAAKGREVVILERGPHIDPSEFTEDERIQFSDLFQDGALQLSLDKNFKVLQGMCVGGTTVVNNAVCFDLPQHVLERWNDPDGLDAGLDPDRLSRAFKELRDWLPVLPQDGERGAPLGEGGVKLGEGIAQLRLSEEPWDFDVVEANIADCFGCGYCNIGCAYGKKLSALDTILPRAQRESGTDAVQILSECEVLKIRTRQGGSVDRVECRLGDGRRLDIKANTVVLAAGSIASSLILQRSGIGGDLPGSNLGFNMGAPITAEFPERLDSYDGLQISHYLRPPGDDGLILESWFNPVGTQALFMPGWFADHRANMLRYAHMASCGSVVGTRRNAKVKPGFRGRGMKLDYVPAAEDRERLVAGLKLIGKIFLKAGADKVIPTTHRYMPISDEADLDTWEREIVDHTDIQLHSSHPQGGNPISRDRTKGVVDERFQVHGVEDLYVCDASVFPSPITVNPQLTVMALADCAADGIG